MSDHHHDEYASDRHDHRGDYADQRHDHDGDYAGLHHRHYDDESAARGLRQDLGAAEERIRAAGGRPARRPRVHPRPGSPAADVRDLPGRHRGPADCRGARRALTAPATCRATAPGPILTALRPGHLPSLPRQGRPADTAVPGTRPLATLITDAAAQECTYCRARPGVPCVTGPDGWHLARFLGVLHGRAEARLVGAAATPHGDMSGIVRDALPEVTP